MPQTASNAKFSMTARPEAD